MEKYVNALKKSALFAGIEQNEILSLLHCVDAKVLNYKKGEFVLRQGDEMVDIALLLDGSLHIQSDDYWGNRSILGHVSGGEIFGEAYVLSHDSRILNDVVAVENSVVMFINAKRIISVCSSTCVFHTKVVQNMFLVISEKNKKLVQKLGHVCKRSIREKLNSYLSQEAKKQKSPNIIIPFNRQQLADFLSVDRSAMSNELCKMRDEGLIEFRKNYFRLL
ncbi:MAG: Crp/Fnr family transcriptional regulator [Eubacteriales bacterium]|nr:Crp/Fnr family transcriptional regulator [Eubacteriales bacterium]